MLKHHFKIRNYHVRRRESDSSIPKLRIVLLSDLHNKPYEHIVAQVKELSADMIAIAGDLAYGYTQHHRTDGFLKVCGDVAPTYVSLGNHDNTITIREMDIGSAVLLDNRYEDIAIRDIRLRIGGLSSSPSYGRNPTEMKNTEAAQLRSSDPPPESQPATEWLMDFAATSSYKIMLCHQPEFYPLYLQALPIDLILSGHAHGGQWRIPFTTQGVYTPGQGWFPKLTGGVIDERLIIGRGLSNTTWIPRFFNPREIVVINV